MELKIVISVLAVMMILFIGNGNAAQSEECIQNCAYKCKGETMACFYRCIAGCPGQAQTPQELDRHYYCKLGCSYDQCQKYGNDMSKMGSCLNHCTNKICNIEPPTASPPTHDLV